MKRGRLMPSKRFQTTTSKFHNVHAQRFTMNINLVRNAATTTANYAETIPMQQYVETMTRDLDKIFAWVKCQYVDIHIPKITMGSPPQVQTTFNMADLSSVPPLQPDLNQTANYWRAFRNYWAYIVIPKKWQPKTFWQLTQNTKVTDYPTVFNVVAKWQPFKEELKIRLKPYLFKQNGNQWYSGADGAKENNEQGYWVPAPAIQTDALGMMGAYLQFGVFCFPYLEDSQGGDIYNLLTSGMNFKIGADAYFHTDFWKLTGRDVGGNVQVGNLTLAQDTPDNIPPDPWLEPTYEEGTDSTSNPHPMPKD